MIQLTTVLNKDNVNRIKFIRNGVPLHLNGITKIELFIPEINLTISDEVPSEYPLKWILDPEEVGVLELKLGLVESLINKYIISTTGDIELGSEIIKNVPEQIISLLEKRMLAFGNGLGVSSQVTMVKRSSKEIILTTPCTDTGQGVALKFFKEIENNLHTAKLFIFNEAEYPNGLYWTDFKLKVDIGL